LGVLQAVGLCRRGHAVLLCDGERSAASFRLPPVPGLSDKAQILGQIVNSRCGACRTRLQNRIQIFSALFWIRTCESSVFSLQFFSCRPFGKAIVRKAAFRTAAVAIGRVLDRLHKALPGPRSPMREEHAPLLRPPRHLVTRPGSVIEPDDRRAPAPFAALKRCSSVSSLMSHARCLCRENRIR
jgi:hypothetical protein